MGSRFLFNDTLWDELSDRIAKARSVRVAVAYLSGGAQKPLPLRKGDQLVVDMSLPTVRAGMTDPREVRKFLRRGVQVFSRGSLHAKFFIIDRIVIAGSANMSSHARNDLDEAAILSDDGAAIRRAAFTFEQLCTEPVRKEYLDRCIEEYRPPKFMPGARRLSSNRKSPKAKVWIIGGLQNKGLPVDEEPKADRIVKRLARTLLDFERSEVDYTHYSSKVGFFRHLREGDWLINCVRDGRGFDVWPPGRFRSIESYPRGNGKRRFLVTYEVPTRVRPVRWTTFASAAPQTIRAIRRPKPRTSPIVNEADADALLRLWDSRGRFRVR